MIRSLTYTNNDRKFGKWSYVELEAIPVHYIDNFSVIPKFFFNDFDNFYKLYVSEPNVQQCMDFLAEKKLDGFTTFVSIVTYDSKYLGYFCYGTHYFIACKENNIDKIKSIVGNNKLTLGATLFEPSDCCVLTNYKTVTNTDLSSFLRSIEKNSSKTAKIRLNSGMPFVSHKISDNSKLLNLKIDCTAKQLLKLLDCCLKSAPSLSEGGSGVKATLNVLTHQSTFLINGTPPLEIKHAYEAIHIQLSMFIPDFCHIMKRSDICETDLFKLEKKLVFILSAVTSLNYTMLNGDWCIDNRALKNDTSNLITLHVTQSREGYLGGLLDETKFKKKLVVKTNANDDCLMEMPKGKPVPVRFCKNKKPHNNSNNLEALQNTTTNLVSSCVNSSNPTKYHWICSLCQNIVRQNENNLICLCGSGTVESFDGLILSDVTSEKTIDLKCHSQVIISTATWILPEFEKIASEKIIVKREIINILVVGASGAGKSTLLNSINCMQQYKDYNEASRHPLTNLMAARNVQSADGTFYSVNEDLNAPGQSVTQRPMNYFIQFNGCNVNFIDTPGACDTRGLQQDKLNLQYIRNHIIDLPKIHGVLLVIKNTDNKLSTEFDITVRKMLSLLPRSAVKNVCFVYTFAASNGFKPGAAKFALKSLLSGYEKQHNISLALTDDNQFCVDSTPWRLLSEGGKGLSFSITDCWNDSKNEIDRLMDYIENDVDPVNQRHVEIVANMSILEETVWHHFKSDPTPEVCSLMALIAEWTLTGQAINFRKHVNDAKAPTKEQWRTVMTKWKQDYSELSEVLSLLYFLSNDKSLNNEEKQKLHDWILNPPICQSLQSKESVQTKKPETLTSLDSAIVDHFDTRRTQSCKAPAISPREKNTPVRDDNSVTGRNTRNSLHRKAIIQTQEEFECGRFRSQHASSSGSSPSTPKKSNASTFDVHAPFKKH